MKTVASMREYINEYVRTHHIEDVGYGIIKEHFGVPFAFDETLDTYFVNNNPMTVDEVKDYVKGFFENLDTTSVIELYHKISV